MSTGNPVVNALLKQVNPIGTSTANPIHTDRVTVISAVHHQPMDAETESFQANYSYITLDNQQVYKRIRLSISAPDGLVKIDPGWVTNPGLVAIQHRKKQYTTNPTKEQIEEDWNTITVVFGKNGVFVYALILNPGESVVLPIADVSVYVTLDKGVSSIDYMVFAK